MLTLLMIGCSCLAQAEGTVKPELAQRVTQLVRQLDDDDWGRRQNAEQALLKMGPEILSLLPQDTARLSPEAKERLGRLRNQLQVIFANRAVDASRVTLHGTMTLGDALRKIQESTGNTIQGYEDKAAQEVTLNVDQTPFWEVLDEILDQAELTVYPYAGDDAVVRLIPRDPEQPDRSGYAYYEGVFRVQPTYVSASRDLLNPMIQGLRVRLSVAWEPRARPIAISLPLSSVTAQDDRGQPIKVDGSRGTLNATVESNVPIVDMELPLELPAREARSIAALQGSFDVMVPGQTETFEFSGLDQEGEQRMRRGGATVTLKDVRRNDDVQEIAVRVEFDEASNALESFRGWVYKNEAFVLDAAGNRTEHGGRRLISQDEKSIYVGFMFVLDKPLAEYRFVYKTPSLIIRQPMHFLLRDIDLP